MPIQVPPLRERREDIPLLFRKFAADVANQYRMPVISLTPEARQMLENYYWRGNIRQLKNVAEQISAIEESRLITPEILARYLPEQHTGTAILPAGRGAASDEGTNTERGLLYKVLFDMRGDINDLKRMLAELMQRSAQSAQPAEPVKDPAALLPVKTRSSLPETAYSEPVEVEEQSPREVTKADVQREQIIRALKRNNGRRRETAADLFMSERTLYRKIKELGIDERSLNE